MRYINNVRYLPGDTAPEPERPKDQLRATSSFSGNESPTSPKGFISFEIFIIQAPRSIVLGEKLPDY